MKSGVIELEHERTTVAFRDGEVSVSGALDGAEPSVILSALASYALEKSEEVEQLQVQLDRELTCSETYRDSLGIVSANLRGDS